MPCLEYLMRVSRKICGSAAHRAREKADPHLVKRTICFGGEKGRRNPIGMNLVQKKKINGTTFTREQQIFVLYCEKDESVIAMCVINISLRLEREIIQDLCDATKKTDAFTVIRLRFH